LHSRIQLLFVTVSCQHSNSIFKEIIKFAKWRLQQRFETWRLGIGYFIVFIKPKIVVIVVHRDIGQSGGLLFRIFSILYNFREHAFLGLKLAGLAFLSLHGSITI